MPPSPTLLAPTAPRPTKAAAKAEPMTADELVSAIHALSLREEQCRARHSRLWDQAARIGRQIAGRGDGSTPSLDACATERERMTQALNWSSAALKGAQECAKKRRRLEGQLETLTLRARANEGGSIPMRDFLQSILIDVSDGNPGAARVACELAQKDPMALGQCLHSGITGARLWVAYSDLCGGVLDRLIERLQSDPSRLAQEAASFAGGPPR